MPHSNRKHGRASAVVLSAAGLFWASGCQEPLDLPPLTYETERARIGTAFDEPLCAADLAWFDPRIEAIERLAGVERSKPVEVYIYGSEGWPPCNGDLLIGCYHVQDDFIAGYWSAIDHELVHAITKGKVHFPSNFWEEGTAEALTEGGVNGDPTSPLTADITLSNQRPNYAVAGHFVRFLYEDFGEDAAQKLIDGGRPEDITGLSLDELTTLYESEAPHSYAAKNPCPEPVVPQLDQATWGATYSFSCESPDASQFEGVGAGIVRILELDETGEYEVLVEGGDGVRIVGCQMANTDEEPPDFSHGDIMNQAELEQTAFGTFFESDTTHRLMLTDGRYRLALTSEHNDETEIAVRVTKR
jgi:hypothetical protein